MSNEDTCPKCGGALEYDEVDIGVGTMRGNPGCPDCHWTHAPPRELPDEDDAVSQSDEKVAQ
jgi:hypothetical protein